VLALVAGAIALPVAGTAVLWPLTPSVTDAERRITARLATHQARDGLVLLVPNKVGVALIATEDSRSTLTMAWMRSGWYGHCGQQFRAAARTRAGQRWTNSLENLYTSDTTLAKVEQIELSFKLEASYSKRQIWEMYLAEVYLGHGFYGLQAAARGYLGLTPAALPWAQASMLAGTAAGCCGSRRTHSPPPPRTTPPPPGAEPSPHPRHVQALAQPEAGARQHRSEAVRQRMQLPRTPPQPSLPPAPLPSARTLGDIIAARAVRLTRRRGPPSQHRSAAAW